MRHPLVGSWVEVQRQKQRQRLRGLGDGCRREADSSASLRNDKQKGGITSKGRSYMQKGDIQKGDINKQKLTNEDANEPKVQLKGE